MGFISMKKIEFEKQKKHYEALFEQQNRTFKRIGYIKLAHVLFVGWLIHFILFGDENRHLLIGSGVIATLFLMFWIYHERLKKRLNYSKGMIDIHRRHLNRASGLWSEFTDVGSEFINHDHPYASDLDMVGKRSVFQFLNTTHTWHGRQKFADDLLHPNYDQEEILRRQEAIAELSEDVAFAGHMEYLYEQIGVHGAARFIANRLESDASFIKRDLLKWLAVYGPLGVLFVVGVIWLANLESLYPVAVALIGGQFLLWVLTFFKTAKYLEDVAHLSYNLDEYSDAIGGLQGRSFQSEKLKEIQRGLVHSETSAAVAIKELSHISSRANLRRNTIAWFLLNVTLLWDLTTAIRFDVWKKKYARQAESWFMALGEFESLLAFSHLPNVCQGTCIPTFNPDKIVKAKEMGHPLINNEKRVTNDLTCENNIFIVSGSNMSGKTTFMRTVGVNLVLARAGSFVCAKEMTASQLNVVTSMRIADNLSEGISTFYAELKRIKTMMALAKENAKTMFLIDEIFRGTNSVDRLIGAKTVLEKLNELGVVGMITTHDLELCEIVNQLPRIKNYSFSEQYLDHEILFDYKMKAGVSKTTNAKYLMQMMDIVD